MEWTCGALGGGICMIPHSAEEVKHMVKMVSFSRDQEYCPNNLEHADRELEKLVNAVGKPIDSRTSAEASAIASVRMLDTIVCLIHIDNCFMDMTVEYSFKLIEVLQTDRDGDRRITNALRSMIIRMNKCIFYFAIVILYDSKTLPEGLGLKPSGAISDAVLPTPHKSYRDGDLCLSKCTLQHAVVTSALSNKVQAPSEHNGRIIPCNRYNCAMNLHAGKRFSNTYYDGAPPPRIRH